jgi:hypothetical protein
MTDYTEETIADFCETLPSFCESVLSNGSRSGKEWILGDLQNSKGKSCNVNLETGCFFDHNPAAVPQKGGPLDLFGTIFGLAKTSEILKGMRKWCKDGTLPDGSKGVPQIIKIETESGAVLTARDRDERRLISDIDYQEQNIEKRFLDVSTEEEVLAEHSPELLTRVVGETDFKTFVLKVRAKMIAEIPEVAERIEVSQKAIRVSNHNYGLTAGDEPSKRPRLFAMRVRHFLLSFAG